MVLVNGIFFLLPLITSRFGEQKKRKLAGNRYVEKWNEKKNSGKADANAKQMPLVIIVDETDVRTNADFDRHKPGFIDPKEAFPSKKSEGSSPLAELIQRTIASLPENEKPPWTCEIKGLKFKFIVHLWSVVTQRERKRYAECLNKVLDFWVKLFASDDYQTTIQGICAANAGHQQLLLSHPGSRVRRSREQL